MGETLLFRMSEQKDGESLGPYGIRGPHSSTGLVPEDFFNMKSKPIH